MVLLDFKCYINVIVWVSCWCFLFFTYYVEMYLCWKASSLFSLLYGTGIVEISPILSSKLSLVNECMLFSISFHECVCFLYRLLKSLSLPSCVSWEANLLGLHHQGLLAFRLTVGFCKAPVSSRSAGREKKSGAFLLLVHILHSGYIPLPASWRVAPHAWF